MRLDRAHSLSIDRLLERARVSGVVDVRTGEGLDGAFSGGPQDLVVDLARPRLLTRLLVARSGDRIVHAALALASALRFNVAMRVDEDLAGDHVRFVRTARDAGIDVSLASEASEEGKLAPETLVNLDFALGERTPVTSKLVEVVGDAPRRMVLESPLGAAVEDLLRIANVTLDPRVQGALVDASGRKVGHVSKTTDRLAIAGGQATSIEADEIVDVRGDVPRVKLELHGLEPRVDVGERVRKGEILADARRTGSPLHAPFSGHVDRADFDAIEITRETVWAK